MSGQHITLEMDKVLDSTQPNHNGQANHISAQKILPEDVDNVDGKEVRIPRAVPETDEEDENDDRPLSSGRDGGVDDGFFSQPGSTRPRRPSYAFPGYDGPGIVDFNGVPTPIPDVNAYQHKKTLAQGMMDLALLSANANQLRYVLETYRRHPYFYPSVIFITLSIIFQVAVGVGLILNGKYNIKNEKEICRANRINNYTVIGIFIITVVNVFISAFGVAEAPPET